MSETELPLGKSFSPRELQEQFVLVENIPFGNTDFAFRILIRRDWACDTIKAESAALGATHLKPLAIFAGPARDGISPYVQLQAVKLVREISAGHWLRHFAEVTRRTIVVLREVSDLFADSVLTFDIQETPFQGRAAALIDGDRLFLVFAFAREADYAALAETFGVAVTSFKLRNPSPRRSSERRQPFEVGGTLRGEFPDSWKLQVPENAPRGKAAIDLYNFDDDGVLNGMIRIKSSDKNLFPASQPVSEAQQEFAEGGLRVGSRLHSSPMPFTNRQFSNGQLEIFEAVLDNAEAVPQELWICAFETNGKWISVSLLTPNREDPFYVWAINKKAYEIVLQSLQERS